MTGSSTQCEGKQVLEADSQFFPAALQSASVLYVTSVVHVLVSESQVLPAAKQDASVSVVDCVQV